MASQVQLLSSISLLKKLSWRHSFVESLYNKVLSLKYIFKLIVYGDPR